MTCHQTKTPWTRAQIRAARQKPLKPVCEIIGYRLEPVPNGNYRVIGMTKNIVIKDNYLLLPEIAP